MKSAEIVRELCSRNGISISRLEKELGLGNGTIASSKSTYMRSDRLKAVADYFKVSMEFLMTGENSNSSSEFVLSVEEKDVINAYRNSDDGTKDCICKLLDVKRGSILSVEVG